MRLELHHPVVRRDTEGLDLRATLTYAPDTLPEATVSFQLDDPATAVGDPSVLPFVPAALVAACRVSQDLVVHEALPPAVHRGARQVADLLHRWYGWRPAELIAPLGTDPVRPRWLPPLDGYVPGRRSRGVGVFFTRGVDSWATLKERQRGDRRSRPTHLISVDLDVHNDAAVRRAALRRTKDVARELGLPLVVVRTDIRTALDPYLDWGTEVHGSVFAGIGWLLRSTLQEVVIAPTLPFSLLRPWGSHPELDPCWSIPELTVTHHLSHDARWQRIVRIAEDPLVLRSLQVCWQGTRRRNCGRCEKCLRTMTSLELSGHADAISALFDQPLTPDAVGPDLVVNPHPWCETIDHLDHVGLEADPWRQRWETVQRQGRSQLWFQTRPIQPRIPVALDPGVDLRPLARALARIGVRVDHARTPATVDLPALAVSQGDESGHGVRLRTDSGEHVPTRPIALGDLRLGDLAPLLAALGADPSSAVPFDPDGQPAPPVVPEPPGWPSTADPDPPAVG